MTRLRLRIVVASLVLHGPAIANAQQSALSAPERAAIDSAVMRFMATTHIPGVAAAGVIDGRYAWSHGYGLADVENAVPVTPQTLFRLASVSKPLTAVAALQLAQSGKLDLDVPVQRYCPAFPTKPWPITTREVLGHLAGIRHYRSDAENDPETGNTRHFADPIAGGLSFFAADSLVAPPNNRFNYSTHGYTLVGCVIEGASGSRYADYMHAHVFTPAGMEHTLADDRYAIIAHRTRFYHRGSSGQVVNADLLDNSYKLPGGGWLSSADDLAHFEIAMLHDALISRASRTAAWTTQHTAAGQATGYGLGWFVDTTGSMRTVAHSGGQQGTSTLIVLVPDRQAGVVLLANLDEVDLDKLSKELLDIMLRAR